MGFFDNTMKSGFPGGAVGAYASNSSFRDKTNQFLLGKKEQNYQQSLLSPSQQRLSEQRNRALLGPGSEGAYGTSADYYRDLLNANGQNYNQLAAPHLRQYQEEILPDIAESFAGMGSGATSSSGFRNASLRAGTDLAERLSMLRQQARMSGAQGLQGLAQQGLGIQTENILRPATGGFLEGAAQGAGKILVSSTKGGLGGF